MKTHKRYRYISILLLFIVVVALLMVLGREGRHKLVTFVVPRNVLWSYPGPNCAPNPDVPRVAFASDRICSLNPSLGSLLFGCRHDMYVMNEDGTCAAPLTYMLDGAVRPRWSPDGAHILFKSDKIRGADLYVMDTDGSDVRRIVKGEECIPYALWSPDSSQIAFLGGNDPNHCTLYQDFSIDIT